MTTMLLMASCRTCSSILRMTSRVDDNVNFQARTLSGGQRTSCSMMLPPTGHRTNYVKTRAACPPGHMLICIYATFPLFSYRTHNNNVHVYAQSIYSRLFTYTWKVAGTASTPKRGGTVTPLREATDLCIWRFTDVMMIMMMAIYYVHIMVIERQYWGSNSVRTTIIKVNAISVFRYTYSDNLRKRFAILPLPVRVIIT